MKNKRHYLAAILCAGLVGCSQSDDTFQQSSQGEVNLKFRFETMASSSNEMTRSAETTGELEEGTQNEWQVKSVIVYFFDASTKVFAKSIKLDGLAYKGTSDKLVTYTSNSISVNPGRYDIFAVANSGEVISASNEAQFLDNVDAQTYKTGSIPLPANGFVMSNRGNANLNTEINKPDNTGKDQIVDITLERAVARLEVATKQNTYELKSTSDEVYATVNLDKCYYLNLPTKFYTFRHVATLTSLTQPTWNVSANFTDIPDVNGYAIDPYFFNKTVDATGFTNADKYYANFACNLKAANIPWSNLTTSYDDNIIYSLENCMIQSAQKNGYSTGVFFKASVTPKDNVLKAEGSSNVKAAPAEYPSKLYYFNYRFYTSIEALVNAGVAVNSAMTEDELLARDVKTLNGTDGVYDCYYKYWVRHLDNNNPTVMGIMEFGIVRNNLYRMKVVDINGIGLGNINILPDVQDEDETYIKVTLNVKPWIVRDNTNIIL